MPVASKSSRADHHVDVRVRAVDAARGARRVVVRCACARSRSRTRCAPPRSRRAACCSRCGPALPIRELESTSATSPSRSASLIAKRKSAKKSRSPSLRVEADEPAAAELAGDAVDQRALEHQRLRAAERALGRGGDRRREALLRRQVRRGALAVEVRVARRRARRASGWSATESSVPGPAQLDALAASAARGAARGCRSAARWSRRPVTPGGSSGPTRQKSSRSRASRRCAASLPSFG